MGRGAAAVRSVAGFVTSLGLAMMLIAVVVVPASPVLAATPTITATTFCDVDDNSGLTWTASSSNPSPDGGTADGAVTVTGIMTLGGVVTETVLAVGEFNDANGYSLSGDWNMLDDQPVAGMNTATGQIVVEVDRFNDGTGVGSVATTGEIAVTRCKEGTTTTSGTIVTIPATVSASVTAACVLEDEVATYPITVTVTGGEGATGIVTINGVDTPYTIGASGEVVVSAEGMAGDNPVMVTDDTYGDILDEIIVLTDCSSTTTTTEETTTTTEATTTTTDGTTTTTDGGTTPSDGTTTTTDGGTTPSDGTTTTTDGGTTPSDGTTTTTDGGTTPSDGTTTTTETSSNTGAPPVSVLPSQVDQTELPQTGIDNGPLAGIGLALMATGAGLLVLIKRKEAELASAGRWD